MIIILRKESFKPRKVREAYTFCDVRGLNIDAIFTDKNLNDENLEKIMNYSDINFIRERYVVD